MSVINVKDIAYIRYQAPDLELMEVCLQDFGMQTLKKSGSALYMRGYGRAPFVHVTEKGEKATLGFGLQLESMEDLEKLALHLQLPIADNVEPGGGRILKLIDPDGFQVDALFGQSENESISVREPVELNPAFNRKRFGEVVRVAPGASHVMRCGHLALLVSDYQKSYQFYNDLFGFKPSDTYFAETPENVIAAFMHCDLGSSYSDHHTLALITSPDGKARFDHGAFEILDFDDLMRGNELLKSNGHEHSWGIGRHIQGSQLFDYWRDPFGNKIEHWTDGDLVNEDSPVGNASVSGDELKQWAPPLEPEFFH